MRHAAVLTAAGLLAGCGMALPPEAPGPGAAPGCAALTVAAPEPGSALAFLATAAGTIVTYAVHPSSGCWARLDEDPAVEAIADLAIDASGSFLYASGRVQPGISGVQGFRVDRARGALEPIGSFSLEMDWFDAPGSLLATGESVYTLTRSIGTGYHGGFWRFAIDRTSGRLSWRDAAFRSREPAFIEGWPSRSLLYVWTEELEGENHNLIRALRSEPGGSLTLVAELPIEYGQAEADPAGAFFWMAHGEAPGAAFASLTAFRPAPGGALTPAGSTAWNRGAPAAHPSGRVLYSASADRVESFAVDAGTGLPAPVATAPLAATGPIRLMVDSSGRFLYVVTPAEVRAYGTDVTGTLRELGRVVEPGGLAALLAVS